MHHLTRSDLYSLEEYARERNDFRSRVMAHKRLRTLAIGPNLTLLFEDRITIQYQVQEMLRAEKIFEAEGIEDELAAYNPLIPDGKNLKATMLIEFTEVPERREALTRLVGIEDETWLCVEGHEKVFPVADEDLERDNPEKTSAVHFLRYEFSDSMIKSLKEGASLFAGCEHREYKHTVNPVPDELRDCLVKDFD